MGGSPFPRVIPQAIVQQGSALLFLLLRPGRRRTLRAGASRSLRPPALGREPPAARPGHVTSGAAGPSGSGLRRLGAPRTILLGTEKNRVCSARPDGGRRESACLPDHILAARAGHAVRPATSPPVKGAPWHRWSLGRAGGSRRPCLRPSLQEDAALWAWGMSPLLPWIVSLGPSPAAQPVREGGLLGQTPLWPFGHRPCPAPPGLQASAHPLSASAWQSRGRVGLLPPTFQGQECFAHVPLAGLAPSKCILHSPASSPPESSTPPPAASRVTDQRLARSRLQAPPCLPAIPPHRWATPRVRGNWPPRWSPEGLGDRARGVRAGGTRRRPSHPTSSRQRFWSLEPWILVL